MRDYHGVGKASQAMLPMIAVPTTAGTGSEAQSFALISNEETHRKMACGDKKAACRVAILDPVLTLTQPPSVTALTGIDAMSHALETCVTRRRNAISSAFSREAWRLLAPSFAKVLASPDDLEARGCMQLGACFAGLAIENSMLGATHALANPLTARHGIVHGQAIALMLPHVIRYNAEEVAAEYDSLWELSAESRNGVARGEGAEQLAQSMERFRAQAGLMGRLAEAGLTQESLPQLAAAAAQEWTGSFNPRTVDEGQLLALYERAL
jgi:alcohol dehydrogenase